MNEEWLVNVQDKIFFTASKIFACGAAWLLPTILEIGFIPRWPAQNISLLQAIWQLMFQSILISDLMANDGPVSHLTISGSHSLYFK